MDLYSGISISISNLYMTIYTGQNRHYRAAQALCIVCVLVYFIPWHTIDTPIYKEKERKRRQRVDKSARYGIHNWCVRCRRRTGHGTHIQCKILFIFFFFNFIIYSYFAFQTRFLISSLSLFVCMFSYVQCAFLACPHRSAHFHLIHCNASCVLFFLFFSSIRWLVGSFADYGDLQLHFTVTTWKK